VLDTKEQLTSGHVPVHMPERISRLHLTSEDATVVRELAQQLVDDAGQQPIESQLKRCAILSHELPLPLREALVDLRLSDTRTGGVVLSGLTVLDGELGETPSGIAVDHRPEVTLADATLLLVASLMGDPISHAGIEDGKLIRDVCPVPGHEITQLGSSSTSELAWHIEDAFHDFRADWLFLLCLRNPYRAHTSFARVQDAPLSNDVSSVLFQQRFLVSPDSSHLEGDAAPPDHRIAVLSGDPHAPFLRLDPAFMPKPTGDDEAEQALTAIIDAINNNLQYVVLEPGDLLVVDNLRSVHGRQPFQARYDGRDRWLRVVHTAADLRKSAGKRTGWHGRALLEQL
jgi:Fe(II)/alpha-ketoglutarate-dependent arginine beta-hydroxylase